MFWSCVTLFLLLSAGNDELPRSLAEDEKEDLGAVAKKLNNPVSDLISVPFQNNFDFGGGPDDDHYGFRYLLNVQPVIPISLSEHWNLITRTIVPIISQDQIIPGDTHQSGLGDIQASFFLSPKEPDDAKNSKESDSGSFTWGVGPIFLLPTATDDLLGSEKWGFGPTMVVLRQESGWTYGVLVNQVWGSVGNDNRSNVSSSFLQPFIAYSPKKGTTITLNSESTYDWKTSEWTVPLNLMLSQIIPISGQLVSFQIGGRYYADTPPGGPDWGIRFAITLLFPKGGKSKDSEPKK